MSARDDVLGALALCRTTHASLKRNIQRHREAALVLAPLDLEASRRCTIAAVRLEMELELVKTDLLRVEALAEMQQ